MSRHAELPQDRSGLSYRLRRTFNLAFFFLFLLLEKAEIEKGVKCFHILLCLDVKLQQLIFVSRLKRSQCRHPALVRLNSHITSNAACSPASCMHKSKHSACSRSAGPMSQYVRVSWWCAARMDLRLRFIRSVLCLRT